MKERYELTISTNYVPTWTYLDGLREILQNAIDSETVDERNDMKCWYDSEQRCLNICSRTSVLSAKSMLLGSTTKADDDRTIGQHGEGYKVGIMVLLRDGKTVDVLNYGRKEVWSAELVDSDRFNAVVPTITIDDDVCWENIPDYDLTFKVGNISREEYEECKRNTLQLKEYDKVSTEHGELLFDASESGRIYVGGLFVMENDESRSLGKMQYGYNIAPREIELDRDRRVIRDFDLAMLTSKIIKRAVGDMLKAEEAEATEEEAEEEEGTGDATEEDNGDGGEEEKQKLSKDELVKSIVDMISSDSMDVYHMSDAYVHDYNSVEREIAKEFYKRLLEEHGKDSIFLSQRSATEGMQKKVRDAGKKLVMVSGKQENILMKHTEYVDFIKQLDESTIESVTASEVLEDLLNFKSSFNILLSERGSMQLKTIINKMQILVEKEKNTK